MDGRYWLDKATLIIILMFLSVTNTYAQPAQDVQPAIEHYQRVLDLAQRIHGGPPLPGFYKWETAQFIADTNELIRTLQGWATFVPQPPSLDLLAKPLDEVLLHMNEAAVFVDLLDYLGHTNSFPEVKVMNVEKEEISKLILTDPRLLPAMMALYANHPRVDPTRIRKEQQDALLIERLLDKLIAASLITPSEMIEAGRSRKNFELMVHNPLTGKTEHLTSTLLIQLMGRVKDRAEREKIWKEWQALGKHFTSTDYFLKGIQSLKNMVKALPVPAGKHPYQNYAEFNLKIAKDDLGIVFQLFNSILRDTQTEAERVVQEFKTQNPGAKFASWDYYYAMQQGKDALDRFFPFERHAEITSDVLRTLGFDLDDLIRNEQLLFDHDMRPDKEPNGFMEVKRTALLREDGTVRRGSVMISGVLKKERDHGAFDELGTRLHELGHALDYLGKRTRYVRLANGPSSLAEVHSQILDSLTSDLEFIMKYGHTRTGEKITEAEAKVALAQIHQAKALRNRFAVALAVTDLQIHLQTPATYKQINKIWWQSARKAMLIETVDESIPEWISLIMHFANSPANYYAYLTSRKNADNIVDYFRKMLGTLMHPEIGKMLRKMWSLGALYSGPELDKIVTGGQLDFVCGNAPKP